MIAASPQAANGGETPARGQAYLGGDPANQAIADGLAAANVFFIKEILLTDFAREVE